MVRIPAFLFDKNGRRSQAAIRGLLNVQYFGARGAGGDDTDAIVDALSIAHNKNMGLLFPRTEVPYRCETTITCTEAMPIVGEPGAELSFTGSGKGIAFDAGAGSASMFGAGIQDLIIVGNAAITHGVYLRGVHHSTFKNVRVENVLDYGFKQDFGVGNVIENFICSVNDRQFATRPTVGICLAARGASLSTITRLLNPIVEGLPSSIGILFDGADGCTIEGGTSESNATGLSITANGGQHRIDGLWLEANTTEDIACASFWSEFANLKSDGLVRFSAGSYGNVLRGGAFANVTNQSAFEQCYDSPYINGTLTDTVTSRRRYWPTATANWVNETGRTRATAVSTTLLNSDDVLIVAATASGVTITLPAASTMHGGQIWTVKDGDGGAAARNITLQRSASDTIDGATTNVMSTNYGARRLTTDGVSKWMVI